MIGAGILIGYRWHAVARLARTPLVGPLIAASPSRAKAGRGGGELGTERVCYQQVARGGSLDEAAAEVRFRLIASSQSAPR